MKFELRDYVYDFRNGITYGFTLVSESNPEYKNNPEKDFRPTRNIPEEWKESYDTDFISTDDGHGICKIKKYKISPPGKDPYYLADIYFHTDKNLVDLYTFGVHDADQPLMIDIDFDKKGNEQ